MQIVLVETQEQIDYFLDLPDSIYANDINWIKPLRKDIISVFDPTINKAFGNGNCMRWILIDNNKCIGRIAAFTNKNYNQEQPTGGCGFFECINNQEAANLLFDTAKKWLEQQGMEAMDGPINFGERDKWWGLLVNGFIEPLYGMNYNPPYYKQLFETYGFQVYFNQLCYGFSGNMHNKLDDKFKRFHKIFMNNADYKIENINLSNIKKYAQDFCTVYNESFAKMGGGRTMDVQSAFKMFDKMKAAIDPKIVYFLYHRGEPIALWLNLPDINQYFKYFNGKLGLLEKLKFLWMKRFKPVKKYIGIVFGILPKWQGKGLDALLIYQSYLDSTTSGRYNCFEMQWIGDFNPKMMNMALSLGTEELRRLSTYRYLFDRTKQFERCKSV